MAIADCSHSHLCLREVLNFSTQRQGIGLWTWKNPCRNKDIPSALDNSPIVATAMAEPHLLRLSDLLSVSIWFVLDHFACNRSTISLRRYSSILHVRTLILVTSPLSLTRLLEAASCFQYVAMTLQRKISSCCMSKLPSDSETGYLSLQYQLCQPVPYQAIVHCKEGT